MGNVLEAIQKSQQQTPKPPADPRSKNAAPAPVPVLRGRDPLPTVPAKTVKYDSALVAWHRRNGRMSEQYRALRTHLLAHYHDKPFALIVTSAQSGEGKTVTCLNLAFTLAGMQECRTVVVDCDFRKGAVASMLCDPAERGLADVLRGEATPEEVIQPTPFPNLSVILTGKTSADEVGGLVSRQELDDLTRHLRRSYDHVLFDTPPVNTLSDAGVVGRVAGESLLVVRMSKTRRESVRRAIRHLEAVNVKIAGLVLTNQKYYIPNYLYRYS